MYKNYLKIALRNLLQFKGYSAINIFGLALGIACCIVIVLYVQNELNYDKFHQHGERIYRVLRQALDDTQRKIAVTSGPFAEALETDYSADIEATTRVWPNDGLVEYGDKTFREDHFYFAEANFFEFFSYPLLVGDPAQVLQEPNSIIISEAMAQKYFGEENPIGRVLTYEKRYEFKVTGILGKFSGNSHLDFDFVASLDLIKNRSWFHEWWNNAFFTYVRLAPGAFPETLEASFPDFMEKYFGDHFRNTGMPMTLRLESLQNIYFNHQTTFDYIPHGDRRVVYIFTAIALLILAIACINFMNLATARSARRALEVGLRKVMGADRRHLISQFIGEAVILALLAMGIAMGLAELALPYVNQLFQLDLSIEYGNWQLPLALVGGALLVGLLSGSYPAFFLSAFQPVKVMKGKTYANPGRTGLRQILVILQFGISIFLIICTMVIYKQLDFVNSKKLGFDKEQVALVRIDNTDFRNNRDSFKNKLLRHSSIKSVSLLSGEPGGFHDNFSFEVEGIPDGARRMRTVFADFDYCKTMGLEFVAGRDFSSDFATDSAAIILNETAVERFGWTPQEALGKQIMPTLLDSVRRSVIGVVKDYHFTSLKNEIEPLAISAYPMPRVVAIRIAPGSAREAVGVIRDAYVSAAPGYPFEYEFLDDSFENLYRADQKQRRIFNIFAFIAIFIACMGLFGLATYAAEQRTKEIGIRKVLGASIPGIVALLSKDFIKLVTLAFIIAVPAGYYVMNKWLQDFAYRIEIGWWMFALAGALALFIALLTVSTQAVRAALTNPVESLRYE